MSHLITRSRQEAAFTIVEVMVAALVLVIGLLGAVSMMTGAIRTTARNNERVGATNLARELVEAARTSAYANLEAGRLEGAIQSMPNMGGGAPWKIERRGVTYSITPTACTFDDPADSLSVTPAADACTPRPPGATGDPNGDDFRRVTFNLAWRDHGIARNLNQTTLVVNPTGGLGPRIIFLGPTVTPITSGTTAQFTVNTTTAQAVHWNTDDGVSEGDATGGPTAWSIVWQIGISGTPTAVLDGTYRLIAQAFDETRSVPGDSKVATVVINRNAPYAVSDFVGGRNDRLNVNEFMWSRSPERDIIGYRVYHGGPDASRGGGNDTQVCPAAAGAWLDENATSCQAALGGAGAGSFYLVALDRDTSGAAREGTEAVTTVSAAGAAPSPPELPLSVVLGSDGLPLISWSASTTSPLLMYRIYRDGTALVDRLGTAGGNEVTYVDDDNPPTADYYVTAVDEDLNESSPIGPVTWVAP